MTEQQVNIPLLRKAVEWAEAEAAKDSGGLWIQGWWASPPDTSNPYVAMLRLRHGLDNTCGTAYCIAGYICHTEGLDEDPGVVYGSDAAKALGIEYGPLDDGNTPGQRLFAATNTIEDVRRIAEDIAGERL